MKAYINSCRYNETPNVVTVKFAIRRFYDGYRFRKEMPFDEIARAIKGLELLGKRIDKICFSSCVYADLDTPYYHRFDDSVLDDLYFRLQRMPGQVLLTFKNGRLYAKHYGKEIILPINTHEIDDTISIDFTIKDKEN